MRLDSFGLKVGPFLLTAAHRRIAGVELDRRRYLFLLKNDFRHIILRIPWTRKLWPRRNVGR